MEIFKNKAKRILEKYKITPKKKMGQNFIFDKNSNKFKLIDFGLCKRYMRDEKHIKFEKNKSRCGTIRFMSINCHNKFLLSRRDDLISLS